MEKDLIIATDWERVDADDFYLTAAWSGEDEERKEEARKLQRDGHLYVAYIVRALDYCIYSQTDSAQVFINEDMDVVMHCESSVVRNGHEKVIEYNY